MTAPGPSWSDIAEWYDQLVEAGSGPHDTAVRTLLGLVPEVVGRRLLDLGCGTGLATRALHAAGAHVVGVDSSAAMIDLARGHGEGEGLGYLVDDAQALRSQPDGGLDGVTSQLALMDIPDLAATLGAVHRVLRPDGWFAFVIAHPCFLGPGAGPVVLPDGRAGVAVAEYLDERFWRSANPHGVRRAGQHHRTVSTYLNALVAAGFVLEEVVEPSASELLAAQQPTYVSVPIFLGARVRRA